MMSSRHTAQLFAPRSAYRQLLQGIALAGGLSLLSSGVSFAQVADPAASVPSAQDLLAPAAPAPIAAPPEPMMRSQPEVARPEAIAPIEAPRPAPVQQVERPRREAPAPAPVVEAPAPRPAPSANTYIDTTDYSIGATQRDEQRPGSIMLSERSTGCQYALSQGSSVPNSVCANRRIPVASGTASTATASGGIPSLVSRSQRAIARSIGTRPMSASSATASGNRFYNLTVRPPGRIGNNNTAMVFPLSIPAAITSVFGWRIHPIAGTRRFHSGIDLGAPMGTPVLAAYSGQVASADWMGGYGLTVMLNHDLEARDRDSFRQPTAQTLYPHMSELFVQPGQWVNQGEVIGRVGSTGYSTGPHLHFEYRELTDQGWQALDPGQMLETSLAQLVQALQTAQARPADDRG
ncbi:M23 family metallopeptidase [Microcoleus sp. FACHB-1515]|uniref:M23 family metallopeptidase n=1 Tax=Cyanophyceae TaxID=3028117 RepID=UPI001A7E70D7|nr:M23 family metallopeptidase [Microcoleus sp. FACHB-1515]